MIPAQDLWPINDVWTFHAGIQEFQNIRVFTEALNRRYGEAGTVEEFAELSQLATYEGQRAMFEGYARNRSRSTGVIQWMLNNSWPSIIWHLYDYFLRPGGGFFGTQKACEPLHVMYACDDQSIVVINDHPKDWEDLRVEARVVGLGGETSYTATHHLTVGAVSTTTVAKLPAPSGGPLSFVDLRLFGAKGALLSRNFYWLPSKLDVLDKAAANWVYTPVREYADLSALRSLREARVVLKASRAGLDARTVEVDVKNPAAGVAFFIQLRLSDRDGQDILPVVWTDNYVSLLPGERLTLRATVPVGRLPAHPLVVEARGLNVPLETAHLFAPEEKSIHV